MKRLDLSGQKYGMLTAIEHTRTNKKNGMAFWKCKCDCGNESEVALGNLRSGHTMSCGCNKHKSGEENPNFIHGMNNTKVYKSWCKIKERSFNVNDISYKDYGAVGITISDEYADDFLAFYHEVGDAPENSHRWSIDRIDNSKGYVKGNMRWASIEHQARNKTKRMDNSTGTTGVHFYDNNGGLYAVATWSECVDGAKKPRNKKFSVKKHGLLPAFAMACKYREDKISELNALGYGYTENHGK